MTQIDSGTERDLADGTVRRTAAPRRRRRKVVVVLLVLGIPFVALGAAAVWSWWQLDPPGGAGATVEVQVERGWGVPEIADELSDQGVIGSSFVFNAYSRLQGDTDFQAGTYTMQKDMGVRDAIDALKSGPTIDYSTLAVPPGLWLQQVSERVGELPGRSGEAFLEAGRNNAVRSVMQPESVSSLEGLLWSDTYKISDSEDEIDMLETMVSSFETKATELGLVNANVQGLGPYDIVKIASLIESEARVDEDRPLIASVIYNRLAQGMPLQVDATLIYARGDASNRTLSDVDKQIDSPYNTYVHAGLPPTPISNVSEASIRAAMAPAQTPYLYYVVADGEGRHAFATTYDEHLANIQRAEAAGVCCG
jgi:UPF0755 protein